MEAKNGPHPLVQQLQSRMFSARLKVGRVMQEANVSPSTWSRWGAGTEPNLGTLRRVEAAIERLEGERA